MVWITTRNAILKFIFPFCCGTHPTGSLTSIHENQLQILISVSGKPKSAPRERDEKRELARKRRDAEVGYQIMLFKNLSETNLYLKYVIGTV
jgi:hypothetical protein